MKKLFTLLACTVAMLSVQASNYTGKLTVTLNGTEASSSESTITIDEKVGGTYDLTLKNFILGAGDDAMAVGTINIQDVQSTQINGKTYLVAAQDIIIAEGDAEGVDMWLGPMLGKVPVEMIGELGGGKFHTVINIDFMEMEIGVEFVPTGDSYQLPNSGFENFHTATFGKSSGQEADGWHMFYSGTGSYVGTSAALINGQNNQSTDVRPGSTGEKSLLLTSKSIISIIANGTATTGRMYVGALSANTEKNYSFNDLSKTDLDDNGNPFYAALTGQPDSLTVWVKFKQGTAQKEHPYASVSAVLNNGAEYRDPENASYNSGVVAKAVNREIAETGDQWQRLAIPFDYESYASNNAEAKALLVTISTNADAGKGSANDALYVDDISLVYNGRLASLKYDGAEVEGFSPDTEDYTLADTAPSLDKLQVEADGRGATVYAELEDDGEDGKTIMVTVISADLKTISTYDLSFPQATAIKSADTSVASTQSVVFNAAGQRVSCMQHGLNIVRKADGKTVKVMQK